VKTREDWAVALVSGGLDSLVSLAEAHAEMEVRLVLFADYGQRAIAREREAAMSAATFYQLPFMEVDIGWLRSLAPESMRSNESLTSGGKRFSHSLSGERLKLDAVDDVWIPNRNGVLLNVAAAFAENLRCGLVVTGFNREEACDFPDNRAEYVSAVNRGLEFSTRSGVRVVSFIQDLDKRGILELGIELKAPLGLIWSCYDGGEAMCGRCGSCKRLKAAIESLPTDSRPHIRFAG